MKKFKKIATMACVLLLAACSTPSNTNVSKTKQEESVGPQTTQAGVYAGDYRMIFLDGKYPVSKARGVTAGLTTATNVSEFENGLMDISKSHFSPDKYYFLEGQFITQEEVTKWLGVQTDANPDGLNVTTPGQKDAIVSILEQDYMLQVDGNFELNGISIGIGLNPEIHSTITLSDEQLLQIGKAAANKILHRLRQKDGMGSIPIVFGLYKQSVSNGLSRGVYLESSVSKSGETMGNWSQAKIEKRVFPVDTDKSEEFVIFSQFKKNVESFFPNLNGVVAEATFDNASLTKLNITITTQFFGQAELIGLSQYLVEQASVYNRENLQVVIQVQSVRGTEVVVSKNAKDTQFTTVILK
ncbi:CamS family sex pheromone protein [Carnobacteriaceae bacterium zg-ZUI252]|nr:CamS family sex pheromone protein [Carnobacteriaceae bacterium zg-ZUI252]